MKSAIFAIVPSAIQAEAIVEELRLSGFLNSDVSVLFPDVEGSRIGIGVLAVPGAGLLLAAGPLFAALGGAALGVAAGGLSGALAGLGFPEYEAKLYAGKLRDGNILVAVHVENPKERIAARQIFERARAHDIAVTAESALPSF